MNRIVLAFSFLLVILSSTISASEGKAISPDSILKLFKQTKFTELRSDQDSGDLFAVKRTMGSPQLSDVFWSCAQLHVWQGEDELELGWWREQRPEVRVLIVALLSKNPKILERLRKEATRFVDSEAKDRLSEIQVSEKISDEILIFAGELSKGIRRK